MIYTVISRNQAVIRTGSYYQAVQVWASKKRHERTEYPQRIRLKAQSELTGNSIYLRERIK